MKNVYKAMTVATVLVLTAGGVAIAYEMSGGCDGQESRTASIAQLGILKQRPAGASPATGSGKGDSGCDEDGGGLLYADQQYTYKGSNRQVVDFYRAFAQKNGLSLDEEGREAPDILAGLCFNEEVDGKPVLVRLRFNPPGGPGPGDYTIGAESSLDGEQIRCWL